jgi:choline-sulfatase
MERLLVQAQVQTTRLVQRIESFSGTSDRARWILLHSAAIRHIRLLLVTGPIAVLAACLVSGCADRPAEQPSPPPPDVVLVTIDTLRADRVGVYGGVAAATPNLDRLAHRGVTFMDATAHAPLTLPSHASILTGQYPTRHLVRDNGGFALPARSQTLAETLRPRGYHTAAFVSSYVLNRSTGLARGFDTYGDHFDTAAPHLSLSSLQRRGPEVARDAVDWLASAPRPFFLWVHFYDPHAPYDPPPAFGARFPGRAYEGEVATSDWALGEVLRAVDKRSTNAFVIVTADHGESLGEHGEPEHGIFLYDATLRVPLIMAGPMIHAGSRVPQQVRHVDIFPTVLDWANATPPDRLDGTSLKPLLEGRTRATTPPSYSESVFGRLHFGWSELHAIRDGEWKYVEAPEAELYDIRTDPAERTNVLAHKRNTAATLSKTLAGLAGSTSPNDTSAPASVDSETAQRLRTLGYLSGRVELGAGAIGADPKTQIARYVTYVSQFTEGVDALQAGRPRDAERVFERLVRLFPASYEVHQYLGRTRAALGAHDEALQFFETAHQLSPQTAIVDYDAARSLAAKRDFSAALARVRRGLALEPDTFYGYVTEGQVRRAAGQWTEAAAAFRKALALSPGLAIAEYELGALAEQAGDRPEAVNHYQRALAGDAGMTEARDALARLDKHQRATGRR